MNARNREMTGVSAFHGVIHELLTQNSKEAKNMKEYTYKPQEYGRMI